MRAGMTSLKMVSSGDRELSLLVKQQTAVHAYNKKKPPWLPNDRDPISYQILPPSKTWNHEFEDIERFGRPLCEVPLFRSRLIPSTLAEQPEDRKMSDLSFSIFPSSYVRSDHSAELGHDELPPPASAISMRKHQNEPRLKSSSSSKHRRPRPHKSSSRKATVSCTCCPNKQRLCGLKLNDSTLSCEFCHVEETPKWREGPHGPRTLCNVCGLIYAKREERARSFLLAREFSLDSSSGTSSGSHSTSPTSNTLYTARHC